MLTKNKKRKDRVKTGPCIFRIGFPQHMHEQLCDEAKNQEKSFSAYVSAEIKNGFLNKLANEAANKFIERKTKIYAPIVLSGEFHAQLTLVATMLGVSIAELCREILEKREITKANNKQLEPKRVEIELFGEENETATKEAS